MLSDKQWLESQEGFEVDGKKQGLIAVIEGAQEELLSSNERKSPFTELQPPEKRAKYTSLLRPDLQWIQARC